MGAVGGAVSDPDPLHHCLEVAGEAGIDLFGGGDVDVGVDVVEVGDVGGDRLRVGLLGQGTGYPVGPPGVEELLESAAGEECGGLMGMGSQGSD